MNGARIVVALCFGAILALGCTFCSRDRKGEKPRYLPYAASYVLPLYAATILVCLFVSWTFTGWKVVETLSQNLIAWLLGVFLHISVYFLLLALVMPLLRRHIRAGACAMLWIIPNFLYITYNTLLFVPPRWIVSLPQGVVGKLAVVWLAGVLAVLGWKIFSHLRFRRWLLRGAREVSDPAVRRVWQREVERARVKKPKVRLVVSPQASTPMTIGLFKGTTQVVLPRRRYTPEELTLIFRHELVHIGREDAWNKFFLVFCTAMCWFNPLMWLAVRRSSEDLELSCDETVLHDLDEGERRQYADLILRTAGDGRGFTTCLSASASALRYRLKSIMKPGKKLSGALLVGTMFIVLFLTCGQVGLAYEAGTGERAIYDGKAQEVILRQVRREETDGFTGDTTTLVCRDEEALRDYLASRTLSEIPGGNVYSMEGERVLLVYDVPPEGVLTVLLWNDYVEVWQGRDTTQYYYVSGGLDWEKLSGWLEEAD